MSIQMLELVRAATLAASGHNTQPWKFAIKENAIEIHPDYKRVAIVRALVNQPALILADKPTAALDKQSGREADLSLNNRANCRLRMWRHLFPSRKQGL